jgi:hypothetical protein
MQMNANESKVDCFRRRTGTLTMRARCEVAFGPQEGAKSRKDWRLISARFAGMRPLIRWRISGYGGVWHSRFFAFMGGCRCSR